jgi:transposase
MSPTPGPILEDLSTFQYVTGIDIGMQSCLVCVLKPDKQMVIKPTMFANAAGGFTELFERLAALSVAPGEILIG